MTPEGTVGAPTCSFEKGCSGVDAFAFEWSGELAYVAPPVSMVTRVIKKIAITWMTGVLLIPLWKSAKFWSFAFPDGRHLVVDRIRGSGLEGSSLLAIFEGERKGSSPWSGARAFKKC
jgi:hypothetical protein